MDFLCFVLHETKEHELRWKEELLLGSRKLPTPVLSGSGSRVFLSPAMPRSTPVSISRLKHRGRGIANDARNYVHGRVLVVDGGWLCR
jgi:hypothetical protein